MDWSKIARGFLHFSWNLRYRIEESFGEFGSVSLSELLFSDTTIPLRIALIESLSGKKQLTLGRDGRLIIDGQ